jgi:hypothetical protein
MSEAARNLVGMEDRLSEIALATGHACESAEMCASHRPGHGLSLIQDRLSRATSRHWIDALVVDVAEDGWLTLASIDDHTVVRVWNHEGIAGLGEPVALHTLYHVLAAGARRVNVAVAL